MSQSQQETGIDGKNGSFLERSMSAPPAPPDAAPEHLDDSAEKGPGTLATD